jgi:hypothetical protein
MEWIVNSFGEDWKCILFQYRERNWEITVDLNIADIGVDYFVSKRCSELQGIDLDFTDLIVDWTTKKEYED